MAIDWTRYEGYREDMTAEERLALLENAEPDPSPAPEDKPAAPKTGFIPKAQFDKLSSELAAAKKQLKSRMSEEEQREVERLANEEAMKQELEVLRKEKTVSGYTASYLAQGYDQQTAEAAANAMADGDMDTVFDLMRKQAVIAEKALRAQILKETPVPPAGDQNNEDKKEKAKMNELRKVMGLPPI